MCPQEELTANMSVFESEAKTNTADVKQIKELEVCAYTHTPMHVCKFTCARAQSSRIRALQEKKSIFVCICD